MATTATTPNELYESIDSTIRNQTTPNSITPELHSDLLYNIVEVLSADTYTTGATYDTTTSTINFTTSNSGVTYNTSGITGTYTTGGTYTTTASTITFEDNVGGSYNVNISPNSYSIVTGLTISVPTQITHNLNTANIMVQVWDATDFLVDATINKFSGDTNNIIVVEPTTTETFRINVLGL